MNTDTTTIPSTGYSFQSGERCLVLNPPAPWPKARLRGDQWEIFEGFINDVREHWLREIETIDPEIYDEASGDRPQGIHGDSPSADIQHVCRMFYGEHRQRLARHRTIKLRRKAL